MTAPAPHQIRPVQPADIDELQRLYSEYRDVQLDRARITASICEYPSAIIEVNGTAQGFAYCFRFAPDILELANIFVARDQRSHGLGGLLLDAICSEATGTYSAVIAVNSLLNQSKETKIRPARFYADHGFRVLYENVNTTLYFKELAPSQP